MRRLDRSIPGHSEDRCDPERRGQSAGRAHAEPLAYRKIVVKVNGEGTLPRSPESVRDFPGDREGRRAIPRKSKSSPTPRIPMDIRDDPGSEDEPRANRTSSPWVACARPRREDPRDVTWRPGARPALARKASFSNHDCNRNDYL